MKRRNFLSATTAVVAVPAAASLTPALTTAGSGNARRAVLPQPVAKTGFDGFAADGYHLVAGRKFGIIANPTSIASDLMHEVDLMHASPGVNLTAVFGPEHGFRGTAQAGGGQSTYIDPKTGLPVYNMYGTDVASTVTLVRQPGVESLGFDIPAAR